MTSVSDGEHGEVVARPPEPARSFRKGQLVIVDEASLAGTLSLDRITEHAAEVGAKVLLGR
jgi:hypothetical protein